jgi:hypothetical protein
MRSRKTSTEYYRSWLREEAVSAVMCVHGERGYIVVVYSFVLGALVVTTDLGALRLKWLFLQVGRGCAAGGSDGEGLSRR